MKDKGKIARLDGIASTKFLIGSDGTCMMALVISPTPPSGKFLQGWGHDERSSALHLVMQLRIYADWIARRHKLEILGNEAELRGIIMTRNGVDDPPVTP